jgi:hypothetical protein
MLRIAPGRVRLWALALVVIGLATALRAPFEHWNDWPAFWSAGQMAGTPALATATGQVAWQVAAGLPIAYFPYPPAAAWLFVPFGWLPMGLGFFALGGLMLAALVAAGWLGGPLFGLSPRVGAVAILAWAPATASIVIGQNGPLGLLLGIVAIAGLVAAEKGSGVAAVAHARLVGRRADLLAGLAAGLACYKPTFGLPLVGLLLLRRRWVALVAALGVLAVGYLLSAAAVGGNLGWPADWVTAIGTYVDLDFAANADKAVSIPGLLQHAGLPGVFALGAGGLIVLGSLPFLVGAPAREAGAVACLVGVAASPHAWGYDAALLVPFLLLVLGSPGRWLPAEPWRTRTIVLLYALGPLWLASSVTRLSGVGAAVLLAFGLWARGWWVGRASAQRAAATGA